MQLIRCTTGAVFRLDIFLPVTNFTAVHFKQQKLILIFFQSNKRQDRLSIGGVGVKIVTPKRFILS